MQKEQMEEKKREELEADQAVRDLKKHLKTLKKNELIKIVLELAGTIMHTTELNRNLNEALDVLKKERSSNEEANSSTDSATT